MIWLTDHAVDRFVERVRPGLDRQAAQVQLERLVVGVPVVPMPTWCLEEMRGTGEPGQEVAEITGEIVLPLRTDERGRLVAVSCLTKGEFTVIHRVRRNRRNAGRRAARAAKRKAFHDRMGSRDRKRAGQERAA